MESATSPNYHFKYVEDHKIRKRKVYRAVSTLKDAKCAAANKFYYIIPIPAARAFDRVLTDCFPLHI